MVKTLKEKRKEQAPKEGVTAPAPKKSAKKAAPKKTKPAKKAAPAKKAKATKPAPQPSAKPAKTKTEAKVAPKKIGRPTAIPEKQRVTVDLTAPIMKCVSKHNAGAPKMNSPYIRKAVIAQLKKDGFVAGKDFVEC